MSARKRTETGSQSSDSNSLRSRIPSRAPKTSAATSRRTTRAGRTSNPRTRVRRATPMVRIRRRSRPESDSENESQVSYDNDGRRIRAMISTSKRESEDMTWYERLIPEFFLNLTAPVTGYENSLEPDIEDHEYEILERQRLRRNRRIRRRLFAVFVIVAAASAYMYSKGRLPKRGGVQAAMSSVAHRIEDVSKKFHDL